MSRQPLPALFQDNNALFRPRYGAAYAYQTLFGIDQGDFEILDGDLVVTQLSGHAGTLKDVLGIHRADRTRPAVGPPAVGFAAAVEVMPADRPGPAFAFGQAGGLD